MERAVNIIESVVMGKYTDDNRFRSGRAVAQEIAAALSAANLLNDITPGVGRADRGLPTWRCPEGWQLVPIEPTKEMRAAAHHALFKWREECGNVQVDPPNMQKHAIRYEAMLAAAPPPPTIDKSEAQEQHGKVGGGGAA